MIFVNHLPYSPLSLFTLRNWGFSDSAEVFVLLAGVAGALAYGRIFEHRGFVAGTRAVFARMRKLYLVHLLLFALVGLMCFAGAQVLGDATYLNVLGYAAFAEDPLRRLPEALTLLFQPGYLDILPLYVVLLALLPALALLARLHRFAPLVASLVVYGVVQRWPLALPNTLREGGVWFFNPLAWQVLFVVGFTLGEAMRRPVPARSLPPMLRHAFSAGAAFFTALAVLVVAPWREVPGWENAWLVDPNLLAMASKSTLHPLRLIDILAKAWLISLIVAPQARWLESTFARPVSAMGRHSLIVFASSTVLAVGGGIIIEALPEIPLSVGVNAAGIVLMLALGLLGEGRRARLLPASGFAGAPEADAPRPATTA